MPLANPAGGVRRVVSTVEWELRVGATSVWTMRSRITGSASIKLGPAMCQLAAKRSADVGGVVGGHAHAWELLAQQRLVGPAVGDNCRSAALALISWMYVGESVLERGGPRC